MPHISLRARYVSRICTILACLSTVSNLEREAISEASGAATKYGNTSILSVVTNRSPVDLIVADDESWAVSVNQTSNSISLIDLEEAKVVDELAIGIRPVAIARIPGENSLLVTCSESGQLCRIAVQFPELQLVSSFGIAGQPHGIAVHPEGKLAYVAITDLDQIAVLDLSNFELSTRIEVGRWPRYLALSSDGETLAVGTSGDRGVSIVDLKRSKLQRIDRFVGLNIGHMVLDPKTDQVFFPWMVYRRNAISAKNIQLGWVMASRLGRVQMGSEAKREALSLDPPGEAIADPHGIALSGDSNQIAITSSGTQELILLGRDSLPFTDRGSTDHIDPLLLAEPNRFRRVRVGGRPMGVRIGKLDRFAYVANYFNNSIQIVELETATLINEIKLGPAPKESLERQGERIFYDARRSLDQWYSCHSCHYEGGTNAVAMDTMNDKTALTFKSIPALFNLDSTGPWTWHGWQSDLDDAIVHSLRTTMLGPEPSEQDVKALAAYFAAIKSPPNKPVPEGPASFQSIERGKEIFNSSKGACVQCHIPPYFTDGKIHDLGLSSDMDAYKGFNTPSLMGVFRKTNLGHKGDSSNLNEFLSGPHAPDRVEGEKLTQAELNDLILYLETL